MYESKLYRNEIVFNGIGIIAAIIFRFYISFELTSVFLVDLLIYWFLLMFFVLAFCFFGYAFIVPGLIPIQHSKIPQERHLSSHHFYLLTSIVVTTILVEKAFDASPVYLKSPPLLLLILPFVFLYLTYVITHKVVSRLLSFPR